MTKEQLFAALSEIDPKYAADLDLIYRRKPSWRKIMKKSVSITAKLVGTAAAAVIALGIIFLPGFFQNRDSLQPGGAKSGKPVVLHVLSEMGNQDVLYPQSPVVKNLNRIVSEFNSAHQDVKIEVSYLPIDESERKSTIQRLRIEVMAGNGPDIFLLPAGQAALSSRTGESGETSHEATQALFPDVELAMRSLYFADLSEYYDADEELKIEELQQDIMNAGLLDSARYVLPLGFDMNTIVADLDNLTALGLDTDIFSQGTLEVYGALRTAGERAETELERALANYQNIPYNDLLSFFPQAIDYEKEEPAISEQEWKAFVDFLKQSEEITGTLKAEVDTAGYSWSAGLYGVGLKNSFELGMPIFDFSLSNAINAFGTARTAGRNAAVFPARAIDGSTVAKITYFGAVSAACSHVSQAYEFLRTFLTPAVQLQQRNELVLAEADTSWPVRVKGSVQSKWNSVYRQSDGVSFTATENGEEKVYTSDPERIKALRDVKLSDEDFPFLFEKIDHVRFALSFESDLSPWQLLHKEPDNTERTSEEVVEYVMKLLKYHITEG